MTPDLGIAYLDGPRLRRALLAAADWVDAGREELNRINVFPVPDGDTGSNFSATVRAVAERVRALERPALADVGRAMADACVFHARGNSGMLFSQFLLGFRSALADRARVTAADVARAVREGADRLGRSLDEPVEGTILTVCRDGADAAETAARQSADLAVLMQGLLAGARDSLARTPSLLAVLREAGVVDAGAKAFVRVLEGIVRLIEGQPIEAPPGTAAPIRDAAALADVDPDRDYRYCTEALIRGTATPATEIRARLRALGGSIVVLAGEDLLKIHVHTDDPEAVFALAASWGIVEDRKADDMRRQHQERRHAARRAITIVADSSCDLPDEVLDRYGIEVVPLQVTVGAETYLDRVDLHGPDLYERMRTSKERFGTSQPAPGVLLHALRDAREHADHVVGIFVGGNLSGTLAAAHTAVTNAGLDGVTLVDSRSASFGLGLLALRTAELAEAGWTAPAIAAELVRVRSRSGSLFTVDTFEYLLRSGRVGRGKAWLGSLLDLKPILEIDTEGRAVPLDRVRGRAALVERVFAILDERLSPRPAALRIGVAHGGVAELAERLRESLVRRYAPRECLVNHVTAALGVHTGPGAWGIFYQIEDPDHS